VATSQYIDGLLPATTYHYRIAAINSGGTSYGLDKTFTTYGLLKPLYLDGVVNGYNTQLMWSPPQLDCYSCSIIGYKIYRNSVLINSELVTGLNYADTGLVNGMYNYTVSAVYSEGESLLSDNVELEISGGGFPEEWSYHKTQNPHIIVIPHTIAATVDGNTLTKGDYLGVFYNRGGTEVCGGATRWSGENTVSIIAYGDDTLSAIKDGFTIGDSIIWKIKSWDMNAFAEAAPQYDLSFPHKDGKHVCFGLSGLIDLTGTSLPDIPQNIEVQNITISNGETECYDATDTIAVAGSGTTVTIVSGGEAIFIAGEKITFNSGFHSRSGSHTLAYITETGDYCSQQQSMVAVGTEDSGDEESSFIIENIDDNALEVKIYPNPTDGKFTIDFMGKETVAEVHIFNYQGNKVLSSLINGETKMEISAEYFPSGVYVIAIITEKKVIKKRLIMLSL
jgi:hypothetical protein